VTKDRTFKDPAYTRSIDPKWLAAIRERFADRDDIGREQVCDRYFATEGLPKKDVLECFDLIETEFGPIAGLLRPDDSLQKLFEPVSSRNPLKWVGYEVMSGDRQLWFGDELWNRMRQCGTYEYRKSIRMETVGDFVRAWCGRLPGIVAQQ
jgi:hypothetical protein